METRKCRGCSRELPGKLLHASGDVIVILVEDRERLWIEVRREQHNGRGMHAEPLLFAMVLELG